MTEMPQQTIASLLQQLEGTMLTEAQSPPTQLSITGGQGGPGGYGHPQGIGGAGGTGMGPTVNITAQQLNLSTLASGAGISAKQNPSCSNWDPLSSTISNISG
ncbi:hypothetical protein MSAN_01326000 [Mycena sanguinolenta]|uniref:Uncharacterized protein n=1 Tax=Mycena sanguinolenta TaxID=230812 RepID=A0A8H6YG03_9AGAR|nr:hypothetical protein MSAN_01326000 [Mycena sanguinolenta]